MVRQASRFVPLLVGASPEKAPHNTADPAESGTGASIEVVLRNSRVLPVLDPGRGKVKKGLRLGPGA